MFSNRVHSAKLTPAKHELSSSHAAWGQSGAGAGAEWKAWRNRQPETVQQETQVSANSTVVRSRKVARLEAVLFVAEGALSARKLAQFATLADHKEAIALIEELNSAYDRSGSSFRVECVAGGYRLLTQPKFASWLDKIHDRKAEVQLSSPAMETLTIVAYRQPVTRADVEAIRGVQSAEILKLLMEKGLVRITGEEDTLGRPYLYGTTTTFLESFGLSNLKSLPMREELAPPPSETSVSEPVEEDEAEPEVVPDTENSEEAENDEPTVLQPGETDQIEDVVFEDSLEELSAEEGEDEDEDYEYEDDDEEEVA